MHEQPAPATHCKATTRSGNHCRNAVVAGGVCRMHGGSAPQVKQAQERRDQQARLRARITVMLGEALPDSVDPASVILDQIRWAMAAERVLFSLLDEREKRLADEAPADELVTSWSKGLGERPSAVWEMWASERDRAFTMSERALKLGIESRRLELEEEQSRSLAAALESALAELDAETAQTVRVAFARQLRVIRGGKAA